MEQSNVKQLKRYKHCTNNSRNVGGIVKNKPNNGRNISILGSLYKFYIISIDLLMGIPDTDIRLMRVNINWK